MSFFHTKTYQEAMQKFYMEGKRLLYKLKELHLNGEKSKHGFFFVQPGYVENVTWMIVEDQDRMSRVQYKAFEEVL